MKNVQMRGWFLVEGVKAVEDKYGRGMDITILRDTMAMFGSLRDLYLAAGQMEIGLNKELEVEGSTFNS